MGHDRQPHRRYVLGSDQALLDHLKLADLPEEKS
jgi:hypothetical protein